jgi:hypothetical protein
VLKFNPKNPQEMLKKKKKKSWVLVALVCNPSYSGGRDQENGSSKSAGSKQFTRPKEAGRMAQVVECLPSPEFKPQYHPSPKKSLFKEQLGVHYGCRESRKYSLY